MTRIRVLVADDHPLTRRGTRQILEQEPDMEFIGQAANGVEAIHLTVGLHPDVLILDLSMPGKNGVEVATVLRDRQPDVRIVVLTGYEENHHYNAALLRVGIRGYLSKRATDEQLVTAIRTVHAGQTYFRYALGEVKLALGEIIQPTAREFDVLRLVDIGYSNRQIASHLFVSEPTVRFHLHNLFTRLDVRCRTALVNVAHQRGLL